MGDGFGGNDFVYGGPGGDIQLYGGNGKDLVSGGQGNDRCVATIDGDANDQAFGGPGSDTRYTDPGDRFQGFERSRPCFAE